MDHHDLNEEGPIGAEVLCFTEAVYYVIMRSRTHSFPYAVVFSLDVFHIYVRMLCIP